MKAFGQQSIFEIRHALEEIPGAIRDDPSPEGVEGGKEPAIEIWRWDPDTVPLAPDAIDMSTEGADAEEQMADEPTVIFEVPPSLTDADIRNAMGEERIGTLDRLQQIRGVDALGWFVNFHQRKFQHGVYVPAEGVLWMVLRVLHDIGLPLDRKIELAFHAILRHELFHFAADRMTANWEMATGVPVYWPSRGHRNEAGYIEHEEALANAYMLRGFKHPTRLLAGAPGVYAALKRFCEKQPSGYSDGPLYAKTRSDFLRECTYLSDNYHQVSGAAWHVPHAFDTVMLYPDPTRIDWTRCPIIIADDHGLFKLLGINVAPFQSVQDVVETPVFSKSLNKLDKRLQKLWLSRKDLLTVSTSFKSLDFKQWKAAGPDFYSVRVDGNYRVHLRYDRDKLCWFAEAIGNHKAMMHG